MLHVKQFCMNQNCSLASKREPHWSTFHDNVQYCLQTEFAYCNLLQSQVVMNARNCKIGLLLAFKLSENVDLCDSHMAWHVIHCVSHIRLSFPRGERGSGEWSSSSFPNKTGTPKTMYLDVPSTQANCLTHRPNTCATAKGNTETQKGTQEDTDRYRQTGIQTRALNKRLPTLKRRRAHRRTHTDTSKRAYRHGQ